MHNSQNSDLIAQRQKRVIEFIRKKTDWIVYILLTVVVYLAVWIRTRNLPGLRDVTTGGWTLGPDLDPFLFLRWAKYIVENGSLFEIDPMRYVPLGFNTGLEYPLLHHLIAIFHKIALIFGSGSVEQSAVIFPVFMFALTVIAFFLMTREAFIESAGKANAGYMAVVASLFLSVIAAFVPRTIAGIPEKESAAFFFFFMAFYLFLKGWRQDKKLNQYILSFAGGVMGGLMALTWGGYGYILIIASSLMLVFFMLDSANLRKIISYYLFIIPIFLLPLIFFPRFGISNLASIDWMLTVFTSSILIIDYVLHKKLFKFIPYHLKNYPKITSLIYSAILLTIVGTIFIGIDFIFLTLERFFSIFKPNPARLVQTVAENREPFFVEWATNFGPYIQAIPLLLSLTFLSSIIIFYKAFKEFFKNKKNLLVMTWLWAVFFLAIILTKYRPESILNGTNLISILFYFAGMLLLFAGFIYFSYKKEINQINITIGYLFALVFLAISLQSARSSVRLVLMLVPPASMFLGYIFVKSTNKVYNSIKNKNSITLKNLIYALIIFLVLFAGFNHYSGSKSLSENYVPSAYNQQWQKAMAWVRENTTTNSVFGHWWDYGYWLQSIGERATVLDGANHIGYWNYLMGRHGLTETNFSKTLDFLYAHNVSHFLIDSTDIGKYSAFSSIGSDESYDRRSWIPTLLKDSSQTTERKNTTVFVYPGGSIIDQDLKYELNGTEIFLPEGKSYIAAVIVSVNDESLVSEVFGIYFLNDKTYQIPLRYYWDQKTGLVDTKKGINAGAFIYPRVSLNSQGGGDVDPRGAVLYLSPRTVMSNVARFYLYGENNNNFKLAHSEPDYIVNVLKSQNAISGDFVFFNEFRGPIKIWEIDYPSNIRFNEDFLKTEYPADLIFA